MKTILAAVFVISILFFGQNCMKTPAPNSAGNNNNINNNNNNNNNAPALVTAKGTPIGSPVSKTIDASGGSITSPDGILDVVIPAGALSASTNITIQPASNEVPVGFYNSYSLSPDGQQFQKPITLKFHYKDQDLDTVDPGGLTAAYQAADQTWNVLPDAQVDTASKTVSVETTHFTDYSLVTDYRLNPEQATVTVGKTLGIAKQFNLHISSTDPTLNQLTNSWTDYNNAAPSGEVWAVNNITGGNSTYGTITATSSSTATYTAPASVPTPSTVWVTYTKQIGAARLILRSKVKIIDGSGYHVYMSFHTEDNESGSYFNWNDMGSFDVIISGNSGTIKNIVNPKAIITLDSNTSTCVTTLVQTPVGPIDIISDSSFVILTPGVNNITVFFNSLSQNNYIQDALWSTLCPSGQPTQTGGGYGPAFPQIVQFKATKDTQTFVTGYFQIVVTPL